MAPATDGDSQMVLSTYSPAKEATAGHTMTRDPGKYPKTGPTAKVGALCTAENCSRLAVLRWPGEEKDSRCTHHGEKGMLSRTFLCARDDLQCFKHARYGWPGQSVTHCELHKEEGMVANDRESKRFSKPDEQAAQLPPDEERCTFYSRDFGIGQQRRCKRPRKEGYKQCEHHVELRRKRAQKAKEGGAAVPAIEEPPVPEEQRCTYWAQHPLRGRVQCKRRRTSDNILCEMHAKNADRRKMCWVDGCQRTGSNGVFGFSLRLACSWHTACGMIGKKDSQDRCFKLGCPARATMGPEGSVLPMLCKDHADPGMLVLHPEGNNMAAPRVLNQPKQEELEALKEWDLVEQWVEKYKAAPIMDAEQYRQDAYQLVTRQRAVKMETFVRVRKPVTPAKPRRTREEMEAAAEEKRRLAAERAGSKDLVAEKRMHAQLAREAKEAERKRLAAERAEQKAQTAAEKAAAKKEAAERAAAERAAGGGVSRKRKAGEGGVPRKRAKKGPAEIPGMGFGVESSHLNGEAFPAGGGGMERAADGATGSEAGFKEPNLTNGNGLGDYVYAGEAREPVAGPGFLVGQLSAGPPASNSAAAENALGVSSGTPADVATPAPQIPAVGAAAVSSVPGGSAVLVASTASTAPAVVVPLPAVSAAGGPSGPASSQAVAQQQMAPSVVLGKVYQQVPPEDVYDWKLTAEKRENDSVMQVYNCAQPDCKASKPSVNSAEGALNSVVYEIAHNHRCQPLPKQGVTTKTTAQVPPLTGPPLQPPGSAPLSFHNQQAPAVGQPLRTALLQQVATPLLYSQQLAQLGTGAHPGRVLPRPIVPRQAPVSKPKQPRKKGGGGGQDLDVLFVEECAKVFGPAGEQGLSREEVKSFLSKWSKFPLDTAEGQVKLQQALECGLFEEVGGGRYRLRELETPAPPAEQAVKAATPSTPAAAKLNNMAGVPIPLRPVPKNVTQNAEGARGSVTLNGVGGEVPSEGVPADKGSTAQVGGAETTSQKDPLAVEEPAVLALGAPSAQPSFPALSPPISALVLSDEERASRDNLPLSEEEEALLRKLTVRKQQARRNMVPGWLRESVTAGAARLAWLQARKDRWQGVLGAEERRAEAAQRVQVERPAEVGKAPGGVDRWGRAGEVTGEKSGQGSDSAKASNVDINDISFDFSAVEDLPGDQAWLASPTTGFLGFAPDQEAAFQEAVRPREGGQAQAQESAPPEGARARIPQRKGPVESGVVINQSEIQADTAGERAPAGGTEGAAERPSVGQPENVAEKPLVEKETETGGGVVRTEFDKKVESEQRRLTGVPKKRKWGEVQVEELMRRLNWTPEEEALNKLLECRYYGCTQERQPGQRLCEYHAKKAQMKKECYFANCQRASVFGAHEIIGRMACSHHAAMGMTSRKTPDFRCFMFGCRNFGWLGIQGDPVAYTCHVHARDGFVKIREPTPFVVKKLLTHGGPTTAVLAFVNAPLGTVLRIEEGSPFGAAPKQGILVTRKDGGTRAGGASGSQSLPQNGASGPGGASAGAVSDQGGAAASVDAPPEEGNVAPVKKRKEGLPESPASEAGARQQKQLTEAFERILSLPTPEARSRFRLEVLESLRTRRRKSAAAKTVPSGAQFLKRRRAENTMLNGLEQKFLQAEKGARTDGNETKGGGASGGATESLLGGATADINEFAPVEANPAVVKRVKDKSQVATGKKRKIQGKGGPEPIPADPLEALRAKLRKVLKSDTGGAERCEGCRAGKTFNCGTDQAVWRFCTIRQEKVRQGLLPPPKLRRRLTTAEVVAKAELKHKREAARLALEGKLKEVQEEEMALAGRLGRDPQAPRIEKALKSFRWPCGACKDTENANTCTTPECAPKCKHYEDFHRPKLVFAPPDWKAARLLRRLKKNSCRACRGAENTHCGTPQASEKCAKKSPVVTKAAVERRLVQLGWGKTVLQGVRPLQRIPAGIERESRERLRQQVAPILGAPVMEIGPDASRFTQRQVHHAPNAQTPGQPMAVPRPSLAGAISGAGSRSPTQRISLFGAPPANVPLRSASLPLANPLIVRLED